jgi:signal transduction histidine kinase
MKRPDPFVTRSPYEEIRIARRIRLVIGVCNISMLIVIPIAIAAGFILLPLKTAYSLLAFFLCFGIAPIGFLAKKIAQRGHPDPASYLFIIYLLIILGVNTLLLSGLMRILAPMFILLIVITGLMMKPNRNYLIATIATVIYIGIRILTAGGYEFPIELPSASMDAFVIFLEVMALAFVAFINVLSIRDLERALEDATYEQVQLNRALQQASDRKSQFTARTSHELRTPLSAILAFSDLALRGTYGPLNEKLQNAMQHVVNSARHLNNVINDLLDLSKIEAGLLEIVDEPYELAEVVKTVKSSFLPMAEMKDLACELWVSPEMPAWLMGDSERVTQVIVNLAGNAVKFTERGRVEIRIEPMGRSKWLIRVRDTGIGIPEDQFMDIFEAYRQLGKSRSDSIAQGTGLGLAITRNLVYLMGGEIDLESELGVGTTFEVTLPLSAAKPVENKVEDKLEPAV